ncbi:hypothetical protein K505DRAFT_340609 [Melanomma pulvis-pyrius CBS 109.77]|uniref:Uncharacterized protein n=1 Tax=Melanomma pulvis-pyrius CBS 109.77 TaxID=1314802 RepID=A0A6A6X289_9PLEO|nr:hypothetical protein K505DRAFT_340609 [Melanomma pulvis-pyrius CBS 109.77]
MAQDSLAGTPSGNKTPEAGHTAPQTSRMPMFARPDRLGCLASVLLAAATQTPSMPSRLMNRLTAAKTDGGSVLGTGAKGRGVLGALGNGSLVCTSKGLRCGLLRNAWARRSGMKRALTRNRHDRRPAVCKLITNHKSKRVESAKLKGDRCHGRHTMANICLFVWRCLPSPNLDMRSSPCERRTPVALWSPPPLPPIVQVLPPSDFEIVIVKNS